MNPRPITFLAAMLLAFPAHATERNRAARSDFQRHNPCPKPLPGDDGRRGPCPGYVVDHVVPLACGGPDASTNMQWQTVEDAATKDRHERDGCRGR